MHRNSQSMSGNRDERDEATSSLLGRRSSSNSNRQNELNAAFDSGDEDEDQDDEAEAEGQGGSSRFVGNRDPSHSNDLQDYNHQSADGNGASDVFFDAGDAMDSHQINHPLSQSDNVSTNQHYNSIHNNHSFNRNTNTNSSGSTTNNHNPSSTYLQHPSSNHPRDSTEIDQEELSFLDPNSSSSHPNSNSNSSNGTGGPPQDNLSKVRFLLGRFGRFVGMRVPGATYSTLSQQEDGINGNISNGDGASRRRVMGGGIGQDGVFANLNAKPERRRRVRDGAEDRGEDDDLEDSALPPTYNAAAADSAPPYWETAIIGGPGLGGLHPLAPGGMGWTPGGSHVGEIEDLIVEGLPVGNLFGFAWNLLVSVCFQFVGFLLTYLLHTTHASKCGSRAGLGITLIQYGFYLRTRTLEEGSSTGGEGGNVDGSNVVTVNSNGSTTSTIHTWWGGDIEIETPSNSIINNQRRQDPTPTSTGHTSSLADLFAASADNPGAETASGTKNSISDSFSGSTEWLSYLLMILGWFILLSSLLSYWRVHRWGKQLVDGARRDRENNEGNNHETTTTTAAESENLSMLERLRARISGNSPNNHSHSAEDWLIFPGLGNRLGVASETGNGIGNRSGYDLDLESGRINTSGGGGHQEDGERHLDQGQDSRTHMSPEERRLFDDMRIVGLID